MGPVSSAREAALQVLFQVDTKGAYANVALDRVLKGSELSDLERKLATELVYGSIKRRNTLDWGLRHFMNRSLSKTSPWVRNILRLGAYQVMYLDRIPAPAAVFEMVELTKKYGHLGTIKFVNGVLRSLVRNFEGGRITPPSFEEDLLKHISLTYSHPQWMVDRWIERFGVEDTVRLCLANNENRPISIRTNTLKTSRLKLKSKLKKEGFQVAEGRYVPEALEGEEKGYGRLEKWLAFQKGLFLFQDEGSMLVSHLMSPEPGVTVIDACAAPGTKTTHLAQLMQDSGKILALDIHENKLQAITDNCRRLGISSVNVEKGDARCWGRERKHIADYILVDAPCSGLGVLGRRPDARWRKEKKDLLKLQTLQWEILTGMAPALKRGGVLVYSTCTIEPEENEEVIKIFLSENQDFRPDEKISSYLPEKLLLQKHLGDLDRGFLQLYPHLHHTDGFFMVRLIKD